MENQLFLSIVIPVYNGAGTISRCLDSIWIQGLNESEYEVICVNDCSTDDTVKVISDIQKSHPNLRLLHNEVNLRAGGSRNHGVREARGMYTLFIDADDYFDKEMADAVRYLQGTNLDILMIGFAKEQSNTPSFTLVHHCSNQEILTGFEFLKKNMIPYGPCQYFFKRSLMLDNNIYFVEKVQCEDVDWSHRLAFSAKKMQFKPFLVSHVVLNDKSQTATEHTNLASVAAKFFAGYRMMFLRESGLQDESLECVEYLRMVGILYMKEGIKYMTAVYAPVSEKIKVIKGYIPMDNNLPFYMRMIRKYPLLFSFFSNMLVPFVVVTITIKRRFLGR